MFAANRFEDALRAANKGLQKFPGNLELLNLAQQAETQQRKLEVRQQIEMRIKEIRVKINREKFSEAIDLAEQTLVTLGPDTDLKQLLNSAQVEIAAREKKREQEKTIETIRTLVESGELEAATLAVDEALKTNAVETFDPRIQRLSGQIKDARTQAEQKSMPAPISAPPADDSREYAFLEPPPMPSAPVPAEKASSVDLGRAAGGQSTGAGIAARGIICTGSARATGCPNCVAGTSRSAASPTSRTDGTSRAGSTNANSAVENGGAAA